MPEKATMQRAKEDLREGKSPSTAAGEFVREEIDHVREGKHGARSPQQAIAIGLSKARRAGIPLKPPARGKTSEETRHKAEKDAEKGRTDPKTGPEGSDLSGPLAAQGDAARHRKHYFVQRAIQACETSRAIAEEEELIWANRYLLGWLSGFRKRLNALAFNAVYPTFDSFATDALNRYRSKHSQGWSLDAPF